MTDQSIFDNDDKPQETPEQNVDVNNLFADQLKTIVNENGEPKYKTVEDALKGNAHAQEYIKELKSKLDSYETEKSQLQSELEKRKSVEEALERLTTPKQEPAQEPPVQNTGVDEGTIAQTIEELLSKREQASQAQKNLDSVQSKLVERYGSKAKDEITAKSKELGITPKELEQLSKDKPQLVLQLFGSSTQQSPTTTTGGQRVPSQYAPKANELEPPTKSLLRGAKTSEQVEYMKKIREQVYQRNGVME